ncbi:MAG: ParB/RepB/Spo0J family partition protein [Candidatus Aminicenantales bacterium]|jgi:ParB family chromosome partitioning protein
MKKALGKGIKAFIPEEFGILKDEKYSEVDIDLIMPNPGQPRVDFRDAAIAELAQSIREAGVLQPIVVVPEGGRYKIIIGERRWRAAQKAGLKKIPALVRHIPHEQQLEISLIENLQREELNPIEVAQAYQRLIDDFGYIQADLAEKVGKDRTSVTNVLRLLKLPAEIQGDLREGRLSMGHARAILAVEETSGQLELSRLIKKKGLSVRQIEQVAARRKMGPGKMKKAARRDPDLESVQEEMVKAFGTKVDIEGTAKKGVIKVYYFSLDELNRLFDLIKGAGQ